MAQQRPLSHRSTTLAEAAQLLRRYEQEQTERSRQGRPRDIVEQVRHVLEGGLSDDAQRTLLKRAAKDLAVLKWAWSADERLTTTPDAKSATQYAFYLVGDYWEITFKGEHTHLRDSDGLNYIHYLLVRPNFAVDVTTLRQLGSRQHRPDPDAAIPEEYEGSSSISDATAVHQYTAEVTRLEAEIACAHEAGDRATVAALREECDAVERERRQAVRPLNRVRKKAQEAVRKRIVGTLARLDAKHKACASYLNRSIETGYECQYKPDPDRAVDWILTSPDSKRVSSTTRARHP